MLFAKLNEIMECYLQLASVVPLSVVNGTDMVIVVVVVVGGAAEI